MSLSQALNQFAQNLGRYPIILLNSSNSTSFHHSFLGTKKAVNLYINCSICSNIKLSKLQFY